MAIERPGTGNSAPGLDEALDRALADHGLHPGYKETIRRLVFDPSEDWRYCCGNDCNPCVKPMARAVDIVRAAIGWGDGGRSERIRLVHAEASASSSKAPGVSPCASSLSASASARYARFG